MLDRVNNLLDGSLIMPPMLELHVANVLIDGAELVLEGLVGIENDGIWPGEGGDSMGVARAWWLTFSVVDGEGDNGLEDGTDVACTTVLLGEEGNRVTIDGAELHNGGTAGLLAFTGCAGVIVAVPGCGVSIEDPCCVKVANRLLRDNNEELG